MVFRRKGLILLDCRESGENLNFGLKVAALLAVLPVGAMPMKGLALRSLKPRFGWLGGFTLPETQITLSIFVIVIGGMAVTYLFGLRLFEMVRPKLDATDQARALVGKLNYEVKSASQIKVGTGSSSSFTEAALNSSQTGNAIQIYPDTDTNYFVRYFWNGSDLTVKRLVSQNKTNNTLSTIASSVTNQVIFSALDYAGNVLTNNQNNRVISMTLQFYQKEYPAGSRASGNASDFYQVQTRITRRSLL